MIKGDYKETKIGILPADWDLVKLKDIGITYGGLTNKTKEDFGEGKPYIPFLNILNNARIDLNYFEYVDVQDGEKQNLVKNGDLFFNTSSETPEEVGMCSVLCDDVAELYLNSFCFGFRITNQESLLPLFASYFFRSDFGRKIIFPLEQGMTRYNLSKRYFLQISIPKPSIREQQKIIDILSTVADAIEKTETIIEETKQLKKGLMWKLFTEGIGHTRFIDSRIGRLPEEWDLIPFGEIMDVKSGLGFKYSEYVQKGIKLLRIDNVSYGTITWNSVAYLPWEYSKSYPELILQTDDILLALNRPITQGKLKIAKLPSADSPCILYQRVGKIVFKDKQVYRDFAYYLLSHKLYDFVLKTSVGTDQPFIRLNELRKLKLPMPKIEEQRHIANILSEIDSKIENEQARKTQLVLLKKGLMQMLLSGKVRVKV